VKTLEEIVFDPAQCRREISAFGKLLQSRAKLKERDDIQRFFKARKQLSAFIGTFATNIGLADRLADEFPLLGDFAADIMLGNKAKGIFCAVEFEDGKPDSIFTRAPKKATTEWSRRFEHGFSQLVDWFYALDDFKKTERFAKDFGHGHITFLGLLILGRNAGLSDEGRNRLRWRTEKVRVDSHTVECLTFDDLCQHLEWRISHFPQASRYE
jgi:Shedu protein SduA, C-terminal